MDYSSGCKRRGFFKTKLMPLYRAPALSSSSSKQPSNNNNNYNSNSNSVQYSSKVIPFSQSSAPSTTRATEGMKPRRHQVDHNNKFFGVVGDCRIDTKASTYISTVQERFKHHEHTY
ncbi:hypothetical protein LINPERPRIM_LOCUS15089 [Linum perenne]